MSVGVAYAAADLADYLLDASRRDVDTLSSAVIEVAAAVGDVGMAILAVGYF